MRKGIIFSAKGKDSFLSSEIRELEAYADIQFISAKEKLSVEQFFHFIKDCDFAAITPRSYTKLSSEQISDLRLKSIHLPTTGCFWFEPERFMAKDIKVTYVPNFSTIACAEFTWSLIFSLARDLKNIYKVQENLDAYITHPGFELNGKTLGLWGLGNIATYLAPIAKAFGMEVLGYDIADKHVPGVKNVNLSTLLNTSDVLSLHIPINDNNRSIVNSSIIEKMKKNSLLVNTARPDLFDLDAIKTGLDRGILTGVAVDKGYLPSSHFKDLTSYSNFVLTPHISWYTTEAINNERIAWVNNILSDLKANSFPNLYDIPR